MSRSRLLLSGLVALIGLTSTAIVAAPRGDETRWTRISDTLFTHHTAPEAGAGTAVAQDASGFLWIGTQGGLARWDGYRFRRYTAAAETAGSLPDSFILALHVDDRGRLWIGTSAGGLARYDAARDQFVVAAGPLDLNDASVSAIVGDGQGGLWIGTGAGLDHLDARGVLQRGAATADQTPGLPNDVVQALLTDRTGALWVGTRHGLWLRKRGDAKFSAVPLSTPEGTAPAVTRIYEDSAGRIWIGARPHGAFVIDAGGTRAIRESGVASTLQSDGVMSIVEASPGVVWLGTDGGGIVVVDTANGLTKRLRHYADMPTSLSDDDIWALYRDRSGLLWVATSTATSQHDPQQQTVLSLLGGTGRSNGISQSNVYCVLPRPDGRVWLSVGGGIDIIDPIQGRVGQLLPDASRPHTALPKGRVQALVAGSNGDVFVATLQGLYLSDARGSRVERLNVPGRSPTAAIRALSFDSGILWLGGVLDGLWKLDAHSAEGLTVLSHEAGYRLGDARITTIQRGKDTSLWVGTRRGLAHVDTVTGAIERAPVDVADPTQLPGGFVSSTLLDRNGRLWVSSFGVGIQVLERRDERGHWRFHRLGLREGLPHVGVDKLLEDVHGNIWASTDNGLAFIDGKSFAMRTLQWPEGVSIRSFWTNSGATTASGELLFGGAGGLAVVRPDHMTQWKFNAPVVVSDVRTGSKSLPVDRFNHVTSASIPLMISHKDRSLRVEFSALDYSAPGRNRYGYRLQGFDADWIVADTDTRLAAYTNLPPGNFTLELRGSNREGAWSRPLLMPIRVLPAWYQTLWFRSVGALGTLGLIIALMQARTVFLRRRQRELKTLIAERTAELEQRGEELRESQRQLQHIAYSDPLTDLPNRRHFDDELRRRVELALRRGGVFTLLLIDLDGFKLINDTLGHDAGDAMLVATAVRMNHAVRAADFVARLGGDEFAVILTQTGELEVIEAICRRIVTNLAEPVAFKESTMQVTASMGSALCPSQGATADELYKAADVALYDAKNSGRNTWRWHGSSTTTQLNRALAAANVSAEPPID